MVRTHANRAAEMEVFVRVVEQGGFSAASRLLDMTPSAVSKLVARLEARLGARLFNRSTRRLQLTSEGAAFYADASRILAEMDAAERQVATGEEAAGPIRFNSSASYMTHILAPVLGEFLDAHPRISLDIVQTDQVIDLLAERTDVVVRAGPLKDSSLVARKLGVARMEIVAAPAYLARHGAPRTVADLAGHRLVGFGYRRAQRGWRLCDAEKGEIEVAATGSVQASDGEAIRHLVLGGAGIGRLAGFTVRDDIAAGRLVPVLGDAQAGEQEAFHAVYVGRSGPVPARVRAFLDFLSARARIGA